MIRFLFKTCILLCLLFIGLSFFLPAGKNGSSGGQSAGLFATVAAVGTFIADMDGFCDRHPQSCGTGKSLFGTMADKAQAGAVFAYQWFGENLHQGAENTEQHLSAQSGAPERETQADKVSPPAAASAAADDKTIESLIADAPPTAPIPAKTAPAPMPVKSEPAKTEKPAPAAARPKPSAPRIRKQARKPAQPRQAEPKVIFLKQPRPLDKPKAKPQKAEAHKPLPAKKAVKRQD